MICRRVLLGVAWLCGSRKSCRAVRRSEIRLHETSTATLRVMGAKISETAERNGRASHPNMCFSKYVFECAEDLRARNHRSQRVVTEANRLCPAFAADRDHVRRYSRRNPNARTNVPGAYCYRISLSDFAKTLSRTLRMNSGQFIENCAGSGQPSPSTQAIHIVNDAQDAPPE